MKSIAENMHLMEKDYFKKTIPELSIGDTVRVLVKIIEEEKTRTQGYEGLLIRKKGSGMQFTITVRKVSYGQGVERTFPVYSPFVEKVEVVKHGKARRARLYYLRRKIGKKTVLREVREQEEQTVQPSEQPA